MQTKWGVHKDHLLTAADKFSSVGLSYSGANKDHPPSSIHPYFWLDSTDINTLRVSGETQYGKGIVEGAQVINWLHKGLHPPQTSNITATADITVSYYCMTPMVRWIWSGVNRVFTAGTLAGAWNFLHQPNSGYSIYIVFKNNIVPAVGTNSFILNTKAAGTSIGFNLNLGDTALASYNASVAIRVATGVAYNYNNLQINPYPLYSGNDSPKVYSLLHTNDSNLKPCGVLYLNGKAISTLSTTVRFANGNNSSNPVQIGYSAASAVAGLDGYLGQLLIYNQRHDIATHNNIVQWLKEKYNV